MSEGARLTEQELAATAAAVIRRGSLSFAMAARLLGRSTRDSVVMLYSWCRHCDDVIDGQTAGHAAGAGAGDLDAVRELSRSTAAAVRGQGQERHPAFAGLAVVARRHDLPEVYLQDLIAGMRMDVVGATYESFADLRLYCYRVAGAVGLLFSHITGVSDAAALPHAVDLGIAMQLTNIARDVRTDLEMGRVYLPTLWLDDANVDPRRLLDADQRPRLVSLVERLLDAADQYYASGDRGLKYLPLRAAFAAAAARHVYAEIGREVRRRGPAAWDQRVVVSLPRKLTLLGVALWSVAKTLPYRVRRPWQPTRLTGSWRYQ